MAALLGVADAGSNMQAALCTYIADPVIVYSCFAHNMNTAVKAVRADTDKDVAILSEKARSVADNIFLDIELYLATSTL